MTTSPNGREPDFQATEAAEAASATVCKLRSVPSTSPPPAPWRPSSHSSSSCGASYRHGSCMQVAITTYFWKDHIASTYVIICHYFKYFQTKVCWEWQLWKGLDSEGKLGLLWFGVGRACLSSNSNGVGLLMRARQEWFLHGWPWCPLFWHMIALDASWIMHLAARPCKAKFNAARKKAQTGKYWEEGRWAWDGHGTDMDRLWACEGEQPRRTIRGGLQGKSTRSLKPTGDCG